MTKLDVGLSLLEKFKVKGKEPSIHISPENLEKGRREFIAACERSDREERIRMAEAADAISHIYITF
jgi:hypothetical protein